MPHRRFWLRGASVLALAALPAKAQTGTLVGRVTNAATGAPVATARVTITGTTIAASLDAEGRFRLANVPTSAREIGARSVGYMPIVMSVSVAANETTSVALTMVASAVELDATVITGSAGDMRRRAIGNSVAVVDAAEVVARSAVANLAELLQAKTPGLALLQPSGTIGTAARFRLRGAGSIYAGNSPTIYVDGVRVSSRDQGNYDVFGQSTSALDAINLADIESIEVIKGPSAATLYGAEAAAGVIQIFTKKGRANANRITWESRVEAGRSDWDSHLRPVNFSVATPSRLSDTLNWPGFKGKSLGDVVSFRPMTDGRALRTAALSRVFVSASGGADAYTFFVSLGKSNDEGVFFNNFSNLGSLRGNFSFIPTNTLTFATSVALSRNHTRLPLNDDAGPLGLILSSYLAAPGRRYAFPGGDNYSTITPEVANTYDNEVSADRYTIGSNVEYTPVAWFKNAFRVGVDANIGRAELYFAPDPLGKRPFVARGSLALDNTKGLIAQGRPLNQDITLTYDGTVLRELRSRLASNTSFGVQYLANSFRRTDAIGLDLGSVGLRSIAGAAVTSSSESWSEQQSLGLYAQQQFSIKDRLFLTMATRMDNNSAFGSKLKRVLYPKASISYVMSEEPYFKVPHVDALRLRAAWGQAGNAPGPFDASRFYESTPVTLASGTASGRRYGSVGNPDLRPERGSEMEAGFDAALIENRIGLDISYYSKTMRDALVRVAVPPSTGFIGDQLINLGTSSNRGIEMVLTTTPVRLKQVAVDATVAFATNRNRLDSFGDHRAPIIFGFNANSQRFQERFPLGAMWAQRAKYNPDGALLKVGGRPVVDSTSVYMGPSTPTREMSLAGGVLLLGRLRIRALADYKAGHFQFNVKDMRRDRDSVSWETVNPAADPDEVLVRKSQFVTFPYIQPADFVKLRDVSLSFDVPERIVQRVAHRVTLTVAGHNLKIWTKYGGADPEVNYSGPNRFNSDDSWVQPQTRRYSAAIAVVF